jgi:threonine dehydrogenase-like Zn-dependent dehydrogenase
MIIDMHVHPFCKEATMRPSAEEAARLLCGGITNRKRLNSIAAALSRVCTQRCVSDIIEEMDEAGVDKAVIVGANFAPEHLDYSPVLGQEVRLIGSTSHGMEENFREKKMGTFEVVPTLHREGKIDFAGFVTHTFPVHEYRKAMRVVFDKKNEKTIKVALEH